MGMESMRLYKVTDAKMLSVAQEFANELEKNYLPKFAEFYGNIFTENFIPEFRNEINYAESIPSDDVLIDLQAKETLDVASIHKRAIREVRLARSYAELAFDDDGMTMKTIGYNNLDKIRGNAMEACKFMNEFATQMRKHQAALVAQHYPEMKFEYLSQLAVDFRREIDEQDAAKNDRSRYTVERIHAYNHVWETMALIVKLKEFPLEGDEVALEIFTLPRPEEQSSSEL